MLKVQDLLKRQGQVHLKDNIQDLNMSSMSNTFSMFIIDQSKALAMHQHNGQFKVIATATKAEVPQT
jgi:hypothetical protein